MGELGGTGIGRNGNWEEWKLEGMEIGNNGNWEEWEVGNGGTEEKVGRARENPHPAFQNGQNYQCFLTYTSKSEISQTSSKSRKFLLSLHP